MKITKEIYIEELVDLIPESVVYLREKGIRCIACGEPIWGTLEEAARDKGFDYRAIQQFVNDLNEISEKGSEKPGPDHRDHRTNFKP